MFSFGERRDAPKEVRKGLIWGKYHHLEIKKRGLEKRTARAGQRELKTSYCGKRGQHLSLLMLPGKLSSQVQMRNHT